MTRGAVMIRGAGGVRLPIEPGAQTPARKAVPLRWGTTARKAVLLRWGAPARKAVLLRWGATARKAVPLRWGEAAFTLPIVLVVMAGLLVLLGGLMTIVTLERQTARAHLNAYNADLATRSALAEVRTILSGRTANDSYVIVRAPIRVAYDDDRDGSVGPKEDAARPYLFLAKAGEGTGGLSFDYTPLFSAAAKPASTKLLELPADAGLPAGDSERVSLRALPWEKAPVLGWRYLRNSDGKKVARFAFWLEDTEAYLDAAVAGNARGGEARHVRTAGQWPDWPDGAAVPPPYARDATSLPPWTAPGLYPVAPGRGLGDPLDQIALYALDPNGKPDDQTDFDNRLIGVREWAATPDSILAAMGVPAPLARDLDGHLRNDEGRRMEENLTAGNAGYEERAVVPPVPGIDPSVVGEPKINLNAALRTGGAVAVSDLAARIRRAYPEFETRKGGFPEDYAATLAANMIDYADLDSTPTREEGLYRGVDSHPLVSEWLVRYRWSWEGDPYDGKGVVTEGGRKYVLLTVSAYAELWNMSNHPVEGQLEFDYETNYSFSLGVIPAVSLMDEDTLGRPIEAIDPRRGQSGSRHELEKKDDGRWYFPPVRIAMTPNQYVVRKIGEVRYKLDAGLSFMWVPSPLQLDNDDGLSRYTMRWNGVVADQARGGLNRSSSALHYPSDTKSSPRQKVRCTIPGFFNGEYGVYHNGMGDPRIAYFSDVKQAQNSYPANYSGWRRNVRLRIFRGNQTRIYGRVIPSEWPDGGHDSVFGSESYYTDDPRVNPDDPRFERGKPATEPRKAPARLSNMGRFFSETELGHVFDPVMWGTNKGVPSAALERWTEEVRDDSRPSNAMGGGNTLRVGRPEHPRFDKPGQRASGLLDLFHCGRPFSPNESERAGPLVWRRGQVNLNTAPREVLRCLAAGLLVQDPALAMETTATPTREDKAPATKPLEVGPPVAGDPAGVLADAIIAGRPYVSPSQVALVRDGSGRPVFGNRALYPQRDRLQWSDAAAEEAFARLYNSATVRSRNFRVHVIGQAVREDGAGGLKVLSTRRKLFRVFASPGGRDPAGEIVPGNMRIQVIYEKNR